MKCNVQSVMYLFRCSKVLFCFSVIALLSYDSRIGIPVTEIKIKRMGGAVYMVRELD